MKVWEYEGLIKIHPFLKQNQESEFQFAFFSIDKSEKVAYIAPIDKEHQWQKKELRQYYKGLQIAYNMLKAL